MRLRLLDLDGSLTGQPPLASAQRLDMRDLGPGLRLWAWPRVMAAFAARVAMAAAPEGEGTLVTFLGSGDYHNLTPALIAGVAEPFTLVHFDNHPDWVRFAPRHHCGAWVNRALRHPALARVVTMGPCSDDLVWPELKGGNLGALRSGRLQLHPWKHAPSRVLGRVGDNLGHRQQGRHLVWRNLADEDRAFYFAEIAAALPTRAIWITIDKDVLRPADAFTNWDQGEMPLADLLLGLRTMIAGHRVLGIDICGEYAPIRHDNLAKRWESFTDQPRDPARAEDLDLNARTNAALLACFAEAGL